MGDAAADAEIEAHLRLRDPDRWLSARLIADPAARRDVLALYAFEDAIRSIAGAVSTPMLGEIRFAWWSEAVDEIAAGKPARSHPVLTAIAPLLARGRLRPEPLHRLITARHADLDTDPFPDEAALNRFLADAYAAPMQAAADLLDPAGDAKLFATGRAWGLASLIRDTPRWTAAGRRWAPRGWGEGAAMIVRAAEKVGEALRDAKPEVAALPVASFPAVAHVTVAAPYARGRHPGEVERRARLLWTSARGRL